MNSKILRFALLAFTLSSCSDSIRWFGQKNGFGIFKSEASQAACESLNLSQLEPKGEDIHRLLTCASNRNEQGDESLAKTLALLQDLSPEKLQTLLDFLLNPDASALTHEQRYPYLVAFSTLMDRGLTEGSKAGFDLREERLDSLQPFLLSFDTLRIQEQLAIWAQSGRLDELLAELGLLIEGLGTENLSALTQEFLAGKQVGLSLRRSLTQSLAAEDWMLSLDAAFSRYDYYPASPESYLAVLQQSRQPMSPGLSPLYSWQADRSKPSADISREALTLSESLSEGERDKLSTSLYRLWEGLRDLTLNERSSITDRLLLAVKSALDQQAHSLSWLLALSHDLNQVRAKDLDPIAQTLKQILQKENSATLDGLRLKIWSSDMHERLVQLLVDGGNVPGCQGLSIYGWKELPAADFRLIAQTLEFLLKARQECGDRPPLFSALEHWAGVAVGHSCEGRDESCLELEANTKELSHNESFWEQDYQEISSQDLQILVNFALQQAERLVKLDAYALKTFGISKGQVPADALAKLQEKWLNYPQKTMQGLAQFEQEILLDKTWGTLFHEDFLEKLISLQIEELASQSQQFYDLSSPTEGFSTLSSRRAARVFAGLYSSGPMENALQNKLAQNQRDRWLEDRDLAWSQDLKNLFNQDPGLWSQHLANFRLSSSQFLNLEISDRSIPVKGLGSSRHYLAFDAKGEAKTLVDRKDNSFIDSLASLRLADTDDSDPHWSLWKKDFSTEINALEMKDLPPHLNEDYKKIYPLFLKKLADEAQWSELSQNSEPQWSQTRRPLAQEFFQVLPYSADEARVIALYIMQQYRKTPQYLPKNASLALNPSLPAGFFGPGVLTRNPELDYLSFSRLFPQSLLSTGTSSRPESIQLASAPFSVASTSNSFLSGANYQKYVQNESFRILQFLKLLSPSEASLRFRYLQSAIGVAGQTQCVDNLNKPGPCQIEFARAEEAQAYLRQVLALSFCPLLSGDYGDPKLWQQRLQLSASDSQCQREGLIEVKAEEQYRFPAWMTKQILDDIFRLGKKADLKPQYAQFPAAFRFIKNEGIAGDRREKALRWARAALGTWSPYNATNQRDIQHYRLSFWAGQPGILASAILMWRQSIDTTNWQKYAQTLSREDAQGVPQDVSYRLFSFVLETQKQMAAEDKSLLHLILATLHGVSENPDFLAAAGHLISNYTTAESYDFAHRTLPNATNLFERFDWQDPGLQVSKFLAQSEMLRSLSAYSRLFSPQEMSRFLAYLNQALMALGDLQAQQEILHKTLQTLLRIGQLNDDSKAALRDRLQQSLISWRYTQFPASLHTDLMQLIENSRQPLTTIKGQATSSLDLIIQKALPLLLREGPKFFALHQELGAKPEAALWAKINLNLLQSIDFFPSGASSLLTFMKDPDLGLSGAEIWLRSLTVAPLRQKLSRSIEAMASVPRPLWREALSELQETLPRLQKSLSYLQNRLQWKIDPDHNAYRRFLEQLRLLSIDEGLREDQISLLQFWLRQDVSTSEP